MPELQLPFLMNRAFLSCICFELSSCNVISALVRVVGVVGVPPNVLYILSSVRSRYYTELVVLSWGPTGANAFLIAKSPRHCHDHAPDHIQTAQKPERTYSYSKFIPTEADYRTPTRLHIPILSCTTGRSIGYNHEEDSHRAPSISTPLLAGVSSILAGPSNLTYYTSDMSKSNPIENPIVGHSDRLPDLSDSKDVDAARMEVLAEDDGLNRDVSTNWLKDEATVSRKELWAYYMYYNGDVSCHSLPLSIEWLRSYQTLCADCVLKPSSRTLLSPEWGRTPWFLHDPLPISCNISRFVSQIPR